MIYFSMILYFLDVIFSYKEIQIKYLFSITINQFELTPALSSKINVTVNHINIVEPLFCVLQLDQYMYF